MCRDIFADPGETLTVDLIRRIKTIIHGPAGSRIETIRKKKTGLGGASSYGFTTQTQAYENLKADENEPSSDINRCL